MQARMPRKRERKVRTFVKDEHLFAEALAGAWSVVIFEKHIVAQSHSSRQKMRWTANSPDRMLIKRHGCKREDRV
jgi:hypothetical protein